MEDKKVIKKIPLLAILWFEDLLPKGWPEDKKKTAVNKFIKQAPSSTPDGGDYACVRGMRDFAKRVIDELGE